MIINRQNRDAARTAELIFKEILRDDCYRMVETFRRGVRPQTILDIGANIGFFTLQARVLFPEAEIICVEPCPETFAALEQNTAHLRVWKKQMALGTGPTMKLCRDPHSDGSHRCVPDDGQPGDRVETIRLIELVRACTSPYIMKFDCEGGEASLLTDPESGPCLVGAAHWALEYHPNLVGIRAEKFLAALRDLDQRAEGAPAIDDRWLFWSAHS